MHLLIIINNEQGVKFLGMWLKQKEFWRIILKNNQDIYPLIFLFFITETNFEYLIFIIRSGYTIDMTRIFHSPDCISVSHFLPQWLKDRSLLIWWA